MSAGSKFVLVDFVFHRGQVDRVRARRQFLQPNMKRFTPAFRVVANNYDHKAGRWRADPTPTLTQGAILWQALRLSANSATRRSFRRMRKRRRPASQSFVARIATNLLVALGIW